MQAAIAVFLRHYLVRAPRLIVEAPGHEPVEGVTALVQNAPLYTFAGKRPIEVCRDVQLDSGTMSAAIMRRTGPLDLPTMGARLWFQGLDVTGHRHAAALEDVGELTIRRADGTPVVVQVDGEALEPVDVAQFDVLPGALTVLADRAARAASPAAGVIWSKQVLGRPVGARRMPHPRIRRVLSARPLPGGSTFMGGTTVPGARLPPGAAPQRARERLDTPGPATVRPAAPGAGPRRTSSSTIASSERSWMHGVVGRVGVSTSCTAPVRTGAPGATRSATHRSA